MTFDTYISQLAGFTARGPYWIDYEEMFMLIDSGTRIEKLEIFGKAIRKQGMMVDLTAVPPAPKICVRRMTQDERYIHGLLVVMK